MADNDQNSDEYKFVELDGLDNDMMEGMESESGKAASSFPGGGFDARKDIKRNALIAIVVVVLIMLMYKITGYLFFTHKENTTTLNNNPSMTQVAIPPEPRVVTQSLSQPIQPVPQILAVNTESNADLVKRVAAIELSQQRVRSEVETVSQQVNTVNNNINNLNNQLANINQVINNLSNQMAKQSEEMAMLMARTQPKPVVKHMIRVPREQLIYNVQAVIPGRAWLIGQNGSTLTVREGTKIAGYGIVKLIDPLQGRVVTSSGQVIRFSQEDS
jgi:intracellular multiplication protein IcmG